jgi:hypothetical protein
MSHNVFKLSHDYKGIKRALFDNFQIPRRRCNRNRLALICIEKQAYKGNDIKPLSSLFLTARQGKTSRVTL